MTAGYRTVDIDERRSPDLQHHLGIRIDTVVLKFIMRHFARDRGQAGAAADRLGEATDQRNYYQLSAAVWRGLSP